MDADVTAILAAIDAVSKKVDDVKTELKEDIQNVQKTLHNVQETVDNHTSSLKHIVRVVAGPMPAAINNIEEKLGAAKTDFPLRTVPAEIAG